MTKETGGPAFPVSPGSAFHGLSLRQYAAIKLKVPDSGTDWLDEMITNSLRDDFAAKAMQTYLNSSDRGEFEESVWAQCAYEMAYAMLEARK
ncbi:MAG: hypothetical protein KGI54_08750 [Pseudomonadota bacterium]|nr:hypothetical protein [Pseudomonadota bacterium]